MTTTAKPNDSHLLELREDIRLLGDLLGRTICLHSSEADFILVETVRRLSKEARLGNTTSQSALFSTFESLDPDQIQVLAKAFNQFLNQANIAEQHHRIRRRRHYEQHLNPQTQRHSLHDCLLRIKNSAGNTQEFFEKIQKISIDLVLTAHPTEVLRQALIRQYNQIPQNLEKLDRPDKTIHEVNEAHLELKRIVETLWYTDEVRKFQPSPEDEIKAGLRLFEDIFWTLIPKYLRALHKDCREILGIDLPLKFSPFKISSWIGGDRDGNPNVVSETTQRALELSRNLGRRLYIQSVFQLRRELVQNTASEEFRSKLSNPDSFEPYRDFLKEIIRKLESHEYLDSSKFLSDLEWCRKSLLTIGATTAADGPLLDLIRQVHVFGFHLMPLDLRQSSDVHEQIIHEIALQTEKLDYLSLNENQRRTYLLKLLNDKNWTYPVDKLNEPGADLIKTLMIEKKEKGHFNCYIVSMTETVSDLLEVMLLQKISLGDALRIPVVPLFESPTSLNNCQSIVDDFLSIELVKTKIQQNPQRTLQIMLGYSDSAKRAGRFSSSWKLYRSQQILSEVGNNHDVAIVFFHGRGGSVGRGGGPTYHALQALPKDSFHGTFRVTEQGESLQSKFGLEQIGLRTLELYTTGTLDLLDKQLSLSDEWLEIAKRISEMSEEIFYKFVYTSNDFVEYFSAVSPESELSELRIGSRPSRRKAKKDLESLRAIPWIFAWTQNRSLMASWLGVGEALEKLIEEGHLSSLQTMYREWPFFASTLNMIEMVLAKADTAIFQHYSDELVPEHLKHFTDEIIRSYQLTCKNVLKVTQNKDLVAINPSLKKSIAFRNPYVDPANYLQVMLLKKLRSNKNLEPRAKFQKSLMTTLVGVAAGMKNTG